MTCVGPTNAPNVRRAIRGIHSIDVFSCVIISCYFNCGENRDYLLVKVESCVKIYVGANRDNPGQMGTSCTLQNIRLESTIRFD